MLSSLSLVESMAEGCLNDADGEFVRWRGEEERLGVWRGCCDEGMLRNGIRSVVSKDFFRRSLSGCRSREASSAASLVSTTAGAAGATTGCAPFHLNGECVRWRGELPGTGVHGVLAAVLLTGT